MILVPNGRHLRVQHTYGWERRILLIDPARKREVDGDPAAQRRGGGSSGDLGRASPSSNERERCYEGRGRRQGLGCATPLPLSLYRVPGGRRPPRDSISRGAAAKGGGLPPKPSGAPPPLGFPTLGAGGGPWGAHQPTRGWFPSHFSPWGPPG